MNNVKNSMSNRKISLELLCKQNMWTLNSPKTGHSNIRTSGYNYLSIPLCKCHGRFTSSITYGFFIGVLLLTDVSVISQNFIFLSKVKNKNDKDRKVKVCIELASPLAAVAHNFLSSSQ